MKTLSPASLPLLTSEPDTLTRRMACNLADWMSASLEPFGVEIFYVNALWWRRLGGSGIYLGAMNIDRHSTNTEFITDLGKVVEAWAGEEFSLYDCWGTYDLTEAGLERLVQNPWYLRPAGELSPTGYQLPTGLIVERVVNAEQLSEFERASWIGFEETEEMLDTRPSFSQHPAATLNNPNMHYLVARLAGRVVAGVIAHTTDEMLGIYGLSTLPAFRRRGYATALIRAAVGLRPDLPAAVFPDPDSLPIYTPIGFAAVGEIAMWTKLAACRRG